MKFEISIVEYNNKFKSINIDQVIDNVKIYTFGAIADFRGQYPITADLIYKAYKSENYQFIKDINGSFLIIIRNIESDETIIATDQYSDQSIYYTYQNETLYISNSIWNLQKHSPYPFSINKQAFDQFLTVGFYFDDNTLFNSIKKLKAGFLLQIKDQKFKPIQYHRFKANNEKVDDKTAIEAINDKFNNAVKRQFTVDKSIGFNESTTLLSGGMDSRNVIFSAQLLGFKNKAYTFGPKNSLDTQIAYKIATHLKIDIETIVNSVEKFKNSIAECVYLSDGLSSIEHIIDTFNDGRSLDLAEIGILHSGQIGAIIGSLDKKEKILKNKNPNSVYRILMKKNLIMASQQYINGVLMIT